MYFPSSSSKLEPIVEKALLSLIESLNLPCEKVILLEVCNGNVELFGPKGSETRRDIQVYWNNLRRRSIRGYCELLKKWHVKPSQATLHELHVSGRCPSPVSTDAGTGNAASDAEVDDPTDRVDAADGVDVTDDLANDLLDLKVSLAAPKPNLSNQSRGQISPNGAG